MVTMVGGGWRFPDAVAIAVWRTVDRQRDSQSMNCSATQSYAEMHLLTT